MAAELQIIWDGDAPGLAQHRLSIGLFGAPLRILTLAVRRIASGIVKDALDTEGYGEKGGSYAARAKDIDLEIAAIRDGCVNLSLVCTKPPASGPQGVLIEDLPDLALERLMAALAAEGKGEPRNAGVRKFLRSLPPGLSRQKYVYSRNGAVVQEVDLNEMKLPEMPAGLPNWREVKGLVVGVGFPPGKTEVRLRTEEDKVVALSATPEQVEQAIGLRAGPVVALTMEPAKRLLWIRPAGEPLQTMTPEERTRHLHERWGEVMRRLSK